MFLQVLKMHLERERELCDVTFSSSSSSSSSSPSVDMENEDGTCLLDVLCDPQALNNFLHGTNELQNDDLLITCSSGEPSSLFTDTPSPMSLLADDITPPAECVDLSFLEEALLGGSPEGGGERSGEGEEVQEEEEVPPCDILQQSLQEADITEHTMAQEAGLVQTGPGEGHTLSLYTPCPPLLLPPAAVPFLSKTLAFPHPHPGPHTLQHRDTQAAVEPPQPSLLAVGPGCPSLKPAAPQLMGLLPGNIFPAPSPETSFSLTPAQASNTSFSLIQKAVPSLTGRPLLAPTLRAAAAPGIFLQRGPLPIQPKLPISIQPRLVQISPKPPGPGGPGQKPSPGLTFLPGTPSSNILVSPPPPQPKPAQHLTKPHPQPAQHLTAPHLTKPQPVSLQLVNQGGGSFLIQPQGLFHGQNQFLLPGQSPVTLSQLPGQSPVTLSQLPGQSPVTLSQLPGQSPVTLSQLPGQSPVTLSQLPGQSPVNLSQLPGQSPVTLSQLPGQSPVTLSQLPGGSARPLFTSGHQGATVQSVQGMTPSMGHHLVDGSQILTAVPHHRQLNFSPHTVFSTTSTGQLSLRQGTLLSGSLQLQSGSPTVFQMPAQLAGAYNPQGSQGQGGPGQHATLLHSPALGSHITLMHSGMQLTSTHPDSHMTSISILNTTPPAVVQGLPFTPQTSRPLGGVTDGQISVQQASVVLLPDRAGHEERREQAASPHLPQSTRHLFQQHASLQPSTASLQSTSPPVMALLQTPLEAPQALDPPGMLPKYLLDQVGTLHKHLLDQVGTLPKHLLDPVGTLPKHLLDPVGSLPKHLLDPVGSLPKHLLDPVESLPKHLLDPVGLLPKHLLDPVGSLPKHLLDPVGMLPKHLLDPVGSLPKHLLRDQTETGTKPGVEKVCSPTQAFSHHLQQQALTPPNPSPSPEVLAGTVSVEDHTVSAVASEMEEAPPPIQPAVLGHAGAQSAMPLSPCVLVAYPASLHPETKETTLLCHSPTLLCHSPTLLCQSPSEQGLGTTPPAGQGLWTTPPNGQGLWTTPPNGQGLMSTPPNGQGLVRTLRNGQGLVSTPFTRQGLGSTPQQDSLSSPPSGATSLGLAGSGSGSGSAVPQIQAAVFRSRSPLPVSTSPQLQTAVFRSPSPLPVSTSPQLQTAVFRSPSPLTVSTSPQLQTAVFRSPSPLPVSTSPQLQSAVFRSPSPLPVSTSPQLQTAVFSNPSPSPLPVCMPQQQPEPLLAQPDPLLAQPDPLLVQPDHLLAQPDPLLVQPDHLLAQPDHLLVQPDHLLAQPDHLLAQPDHLLAQPDHLLAQPDHLLAQPDPFLAQPDPLLAQPDPLLAQPDPLLVQPDPLLVTPSSHGDQANQQHTKQSKPPAALDMDVEGKAFTLDVHPPSPRPQWPPGPHTVQGPNTVRWLHTVQEPQNDQGPQSHREQDQWLRAVQTAQQSKTKVAGPVAKEREQRLTETMCRLQQQLCQDQRPVQSPYICSPFSSLGEAVTHLLPYHTCAGHLPSQDDFNLVDKQFDTVSGFLLKRTKDMLNKYRQLLLGEALQVMPSAEMVMLDRLFLQSERFSLGEDRHRARRDPESFLMTLHASESSSFASSRVGLDRSGSLPSPPAWTRLSDRPPGLRTYHSTSRGGLRLTIKHKAGSRMVVHNSACDTVHATAPSGHKRYYTGQLINGSVDLTEQGSSHRTSCHPIDEEMSNGALPSKVVEDIPHGHHSDSRESVAQIQTAALGSQYISSPNSLTMPSLDPQTACLEPPPSDPGEMSTPKLKRFRPTLPDLPFQADRHSNRPPPFPQTSYRPPPFPQTSYRPQPFPQTSDRPQPLPQTSYRPQPLSQTSYRPQPLSQTSYRPQSLSQTSDRPQPLSQTRDRHQPLSQTSYRPQSLSQTSNRPQSLPQTSDKPQSLSQTSVRTQSLSQTSNRPQSLSQTSDRPQPLSQTSDRPQPLPQASYRPQPLPQTSDRPQPLSQTSDRPQPLPQASYRPQPLPQTSDRPQLLPQTSYRPEASPSPQPPLPEDNTLSEHLQSAIDSILELQRLQGPTAAAQPRIQGACPVAGPASLLDQAITSILQGNL
ncbi:BRD4-interacting chromatin-remodeling complex-associated protein isoform X2 [Oncorhynchus mykiss]|uniref:BRD4-interacting chromatin-remodeling complex-associated protein isoform X2 n=1 Tax=Oncorhynchus mykiss TaxID=8022 RepID=UPI001878848E|nr:BRD4-interacting chromatin-remodeling complex-associated protein isoform X2 [Oncorhynchus mykiss]XP_036818732.1 BRD4-interacting chromatin-remodeling complex-associated protein isoform X2 [Oncorhynchus mykiss]